VKAPGLESRRRLGHSPRIAGRRGDLARSGRSAWLQSVLIRLFAAYVAFVHRTTRWTYVGDDILEDDLRAGRTRVICTWHNRLALITLNRDWSDGGLAVMASYHQDAQVLTKGLERRNIRIIELLTTGDNTTAVKEAVRAGIGIGFVAGWDRDRTDDLVEMLPPLEDWSAKIWLVTHMDLHRTAKVQTFVRHLKEQVKTWPVH
jgi:hypothetical protein